MYPKPLPKKLKHGIYTGKTIRDCECRGYAATLIDKEMEKEEVSDWRDLSKNEYKKLLQKQLKKISLHPIGDITRGFNHYYACKGHHGTNKFYCLDKKKLRTHTRSKFKAIGVMSTENAIEYSLTNINWM